MNYREFKKTGIKVSEISLGAEHLETSPYSTVKEIVDIAMDSGVNYTDLFMASPDIRDHFGKALKGKRDKMMIAGHLGTAWKDNQYHRTRDMKTVKHFYSDLLTRLDTDYIDVTMMHYIDEMDDFNKCINGGMLDYALELKKKGATRMIGMSTHAPKVAMEAIKTGVIDTIMFSINPLFDLMAEDESLEDIYAHSQKIESSVSINSARHSLYAECEKEGVGIVVMKTFAGGILFRENSPVKMSVYQCINYALSQPSVVAAAVGCRTKEELAESLNYYNASDEQKDYAKIYSESLKWTDDTKCVYCNHCLPCPQEINIAESMRKIDAGGPPPDNCIKCGICEERCPFGIKVSEIFCG